MVSLPRCVKSVGELPKPVVLPVAPVMAPPEEEAPIHPPLFPPSGKVSMFDDVRENEAEIAEIEDHLDDILETDETDIPEDQEKPVIKEVVEEEADDDLLSDEDEGKMQSLDEFEDIESLEIKNRDFDGESDEY